MWCTGSESHFLSSRIKDNEKLGWIGVISLTAMAPPKKLLDLLNDKDRMHLEEALHLGASNEEKELGEKLLEKVVAGAGAVQNLKSKAQASKKPGPKRKSAANPTEDNIRRLKQNIRGFLQVSQTDFPDGRLLNWLTDIFREFDRLCSTGIFFNISEYATIHCVEVDIYRGEVAELALELQGPITDLEFQIRNSNRSTWKSFLKTSRAGEDLKPLPLEDAEGYDSLQIALGLKLNLAGEPSTEDLKKEIQELESLDVDPLSVTSGDEERRLRDLTATVSLRTDFTKVSRSDTLTMALAQLQRVRLVLKDSLYVTVSQDMEYLYGRLREINVHPFDSLAMRPIAALEAVFLAAIKRQGKSPFGPSRPEELYYGPPIILDEGDIDLRI